MEWERYELDMSSDRMTYGFYSDGPKGRIRKMVKFQHVPDLGTNLFNLMFGDHDALTGLVDDEVVSNNGDRRAVLRTVAEAVKLFVNLYPRAIVLIRGRSPARLRIYQMGISSAWPEIKERYHVMGRCDKGWIPFKKGVNYEEFLIYKKMAEG